MRLSIINWLIVLLLSVPIISAAEEKSSNDTGNSPKPSEVTKPVTTEVTKPATTDDASKQAIAPKLISVEDATKKTSAPTSIPPAVINALKTMIKVGIDKVKVSPTPIKDLYEAAYESEVLYISADGIYVLLGDMHNTATGENLTENKRSEFRKVSIDSFDEKEMIVFSPPEGKPVKYVVNVFTDVDCPYCSKFHKEVPNLNAAGVKVRYLAFPRAGAGSPTHKKMVSVWCAKDRQKAITDAKAQLDVPAATCEHPIDSQYDLGQKVGVRGTPAIVLPNGELIPGYVPASQLVALLNQKSMPFLGKGKIVE
jgi:thiol:disulfide interchange protein DsbC